MKKFILMLLVCFGLISLVGCVKNNTEEIKINVEKDNIEITLGENYTVKPTASGIENPKFKYESKSPHLFTVNEGLITPITVGEGSLIISIEGSEVVKEIKVKITKKEEPIVEKKDLEIVVSKVELKKEETLQLGLNKEITDVKWFSDNSSVLEVDENGVVSALAIGTATVIVLTAEETAKVDLKVVGKSYNDDPLDENLIILGAKTVRVGHQVTLEINSPEVEWTSSNTDLATIDESGVFTAISGGKVTITAHDKTKDLTANYEIDIIDDELIEVDFTDITIFVGEYKLTNPKIFDFTNPNLFTFTSSYRNRVKVDSKGEILGMAVGESIVTVSLASNNNIKIAIKVNVLPAPSISMTPTTGNIKVGSTTQLLSSVLNLDNKTVIWATDDESVATISEDGLLTALKVGIVTITVTSEEMPSLVARGTIEISENDSVNLRNEIIRVALGEVGYKEGINNTTKYGEWYNLNNQPWCAMFVSWCAHQAGIPITVILRYAGVVVGRDWFKGKGEHYYKTYEQTQTGEYVPQCGDIIFFTSEGASHTGLVIKVVGDVLYTVEGNTSDMVAIRSYNYKTYNKITGYGVPAYPASSTPIEDFDITGSSSGNNNSTT